MFHDGLELILNHGSFQVGQHVEVLRMHFIVTVYFLPRREHVLIRSEHGLVTLKGLLLSLVHQV